MDNVNTSAQHGNEHGCSLRVSRQYICLGQGQGPVEPAQAWGGLRGGRCRILRSAVRAGGRVPQRGVARCRSEEHTSELQSLMRISYAVFCLKKKTTTTSIQQNVR